MPLERTSSPDHEGDAYFDRSLYEADPSKIPPSRETKQKKRVPFTQRPEIVELNQKIEEQKRKENEQKNRPQ